MHDVHEWNFDERDFLGVVMRLGMPSQPEVPFCRMLEVIDHLERLAWQESMTAAECYFRNKVVLLAPRVGTDRMRQIVAHLWYRDDPINARVPDGTSCYGLLGGSAGLLARELAEHEPLFADLPSNADMRAVLDACVTSGDVVQALRQGTTWIWLADPSPEDV